MFQYLEAVAFSWTNLETIVSLLVDRKSTVLFQDISGYHRMAKSRVAVVDVHI